MVVISNFIIYFAMQICSLVFSKALSAPSKERSLFGEDTSVSRCFVPIKYHFGKILAVGLAQSMVSSVKLY